MRLEWTVAAVDVGNGGNELEQAGLARRKQDTRWDRPVLTNPAPVTGKPQGLSVLPAAAEMLRWKLRRHPG